MNQLAAKAQQIYEETKQMQLSVEEDTRTWLPRLKENLNDNYEKRLKNINSSHEITLNSLKEELDGTRTIAQENYDCYEKAVHERDSFDQQLTGTYIFMFFFQNDNFHFF